MQRREFIGLIGATALSFPQPGYAQTNTSLPLVGFLAPSNQDSEFARRVIAAFRKGLQEEGFTEGKIKGFKPHPAAFLGYLISHESHHRGQIMLSLKQSGHKVDQKVGYGIWEWGSR